jgi:putative oxidoreductase
MKKEQWIIELICCLTALLFAYTGTSKLLDFKQFEKEITNQEFHRSLFPLLIYGLPATELVIAAMLLIPKLRMAGLLMSAVLMLLFTGYVGLVTFNYYNRVPCSCAGVFRQMTWPAHLLFNIVFTILTITAVFLEYRKTPKSITPPVTG